MSLHEDSVQNVRKREKKSFFELGSAASSLQLKRRTGTLSRRIGRLRLIDLRREREEGVIVLAECFMGPHNIITTLVIQLNSTEAQQLKKYSTLVQGFKFG